MRFWGCYVALRYNGNLRQSKFITAIGILAGLLVLFNNCSGSFSANSSLASLGSSDGSSTSSATSSGSLQFANSTLMVSQSAGSISIQITRVAGSAGAVSADYATIDGTALAGSDYTAIGGTLNWAAGDSSTKTIIISINNVNPFSGQKSFTISLSNPKGGVTIALASAIITISGSGGSSSLPSAPTGLDLVNQGGPNLNNNYGAVAMALSNYQAIEWQAATPGPNPIDHYKIYRNGIAYATASAPTQFKGYISGNMLTVTSVLSGNLIEGARWQGAGVAAGTMIDQPQLSGSTGGVGTYHVNISQTAGTATAPITFSAWIFQDTSATGSAVPDVTAPATATYSYAVSAVDTKGGEGPLTANYSAYGYQNGYSNWSEYNFDYGGAISTYNSSNGNPLGGVFDLEANMTNGGGLNPVAAAPMAIIDNLEIGAFNYYTIDINPGATAGYSLFLSHVSRLPPGDVYGWNSISNVFAYGPTPKPNTWATYKIPLVDLGIGTCSFTGSISGNTLTVTKINSGPSIVDAGGFITGPGVPSGTYIINYAQNGAVGKFTIAGPGINSTTNLPSETMYYRRTSFYKSTIQPSQSVIFYINNFGWTTN